MVAAVFLVTLFLLGVSGERKLFLERSRPLNCSEVRDGSADSASGGLHARGTAAGVTAGVDGVSHAWP